MKTPDGPDGGLLSAGRGVKAAASGTKPPTCPGACPGGRRPSPTPRVSPVLPGQEVCVRVCACVPGLSPSCRGSGFILTGGDGCEESGSLTVVCVLMESSHPEQGLAHCRCPGTWDCLPHLVFLCWGLHSWRGWGLREAGRPRTVPPARPRSLPGPLSLSRGLHKEVHSTPC